MASVKAILYPNHKNSANQHPVLIQILHNRKKRTIATGYFLLESQWDKLKGFAIEKSKSKDEKIFLKKLNNLISEKITVTKRIIINFEEKGTPFTIDEILENIKTKNIQQSVFSFGEEVIKSMREVGRIGNAKYYESSLKALKSFRNEKDLYFDELNYKQIIKFEKHLQIKKCKTNTIAAYMKAIRAIYNLAIKEDLANREIYPFDNYKIKLEKTIKRAINKDDIVRLKEFDLSKKPDLEIVRDYFMFSFYCRGISFVDLAYLKIKDIIDDRIYYSRNKTHQKFSIKITPQIIQIIKKYNNLENPDSYIFPIINIAEENVYLQYQNALRLTNKKLKELGKLLKLPFPLTTYVARHSWATIAKRSGIATAIISEGLGHETEKTTQIYLDSFENDVLDAANDIVTNI